MQIPIRSVHKPDSVFRTPLDAGEAWEANGLEHASTRLACMAPEGGTWATTGQQDSMRRE